MTPRTAVGALAAITGLALTAGALMTGPANAAESAPQAMGPPGRDVYRAVAAGRPGHLRRGAGRESNIHRQQPVRARAARDVSVFATGNGSSTFSCSGTLTPLLGSLTFSTGSCRLGSSPLSPGSYDVGATYPGNTAQGNFASASPPQHLSVLQVTTTNLDLPDPQISISQEQSERLIAEVLPVNGGVPAPFGSVTIRAGATIICTTPPVFTGVASISAPRALTVTRDSH